eukprot:Tbor_TRINITY_DN4138_c0_g1::TRINITY_DN4138_c0_g1_i1::g.26477::m.26477
MSFILPLANILTKKQREWDAMHRSINHCPFKLNPRVGLYNYIPPPEMASDTFQKPSHSPKLQSSDSHCIRDINNSSEATPITASTTNTTDFPFKCTLCEVNSITHNMTQKVRITMHFIAATPHFDFYFPVSECGSVESFGCSLNGISFDTQLVRRGPKRAALIVTPLSLSSLSESDNDESIEKEYVTKVHDDILALDSVVDRGTKDSGNDVVTSNDQGTSRKISNRMKANKKSRLDTHLPTRFKVTYDPRQRDRVSNGLVFASDERKFIAEHTSSTDSCSSFSVDNTDHEVANDNKLHSSSTKDYAVNSPKRNDKQRLSKLLLRKQREAYRRLKCEKGYPGTSHYAACGSISASKEWWFPISSDPKKPFKSTTLKDADEEPMVFYTYLPKASEVLFGAKGATTGDTLRIVVDYTTKIVEKSKNERYHIIFPLTCLPISPSKFGLSIHDMPDQIQRVTTMSRWHEFDSILDRNSAQVVFECDENIKMCERKKQESPQQRESSMTTKKKIRLSDYVLVVVVELGAPIVPQCADPMVIFILGTVVASFIFLFMTKDLEDFQ